MKQHIVITEAENGWTIEVNFPGSTMEPEWDSRSYIAPTWDDVLIILRDQPWQPRRSSLAVQQTFGIGPTCPPIQPQNAPIREEEWLPPGSTQFDAEATEQLK